MDLDTIGKFYDPVEDGDIVYLKISEEIIELLSPKNTVVKSIPRN